MEKEQYKDLLKELIAEDEELTVGYEEEVIYKIDDIRIFGGFYDGQRTVDHNILLFDDIEWEDIISWGTVVVPETQSYISDRSIQEFEDVGFKKIPTNNNHIVGPANLFDEEDISVHWYEANQRYIGDSGASPEFGRIAIENNHIGSKGYEFGAAAYAIKLDKENVEEYVLKEIDPVRELYDYEEKELNEWKNVRNESVIENDVELE